MKVCFLNPPRFQEKITDEFIISYNVSRFRRGVDISYDVIPPSELALLAAVVAKKHKVEILDANALGMLHREVCEWIRKQKPDYLVIKGGDTTLTDDIIFYEYAEGLGIKAIFWEDILNPYYSKRLMKDFNIKRLLYGEPEKNIFRFLNGETGLIGGGVIENLDSLPTPLINKLPMDKYKRMGKKCWYAFLQRGCRWGKCTFCLVGHENLRLRMRSPSHIKKELDKVKKAGVEHIFFWGPELNVNEKRVYEICNLMKKYDFTWECWMRVDCVNEKILRTMKNTGCIRLSFGVENGDQRVLDSYNKGITVEQIKRTFKFSRKVGIDTIAFCIMGTPYETKESFNKTIKLLKEIKPTLIAPALYRPFPNVALTKFAKKKGLILRDFYDSALFCDCTGYQLSARTMKLNEDELLKYSNKIRKLGTMRAYRKFLFRPNKEILLQFFLRYLRNKKKRYNTSLN